MDAVPAETRKYIIGWLTFPLGGRAEFLKLAVPYVQDCLREPGCLFFEMNRSERDPDVVAIAECFASQAAHEEHLATPYFLALWDKLHSIGIHGRFENVFPHRVEADTAEFHGG